MYLHRFYYFCNKKQRDMKRNDLLFVIVATLLMSLPAGYEPHHFAKTLFATATLNALAYSLLMMWASRWSNVVRGLLTTLLVVLFAVETFTYVRFGSRFDPGILTLVLQTSGKEALEFAQTYLLKPWPIAALAATIAFLLLLLRLVTGRKPKSAVASSRYLTPGLGSSSRRRERHERTRQRVLLAVGMLVVAVGVALPFVRLPFPVGRNTLNELASDIRFVADKHHEIEDMERMLANIRISRSPKKEEAPVVVIVVGESFNKHHASLYGYPLPTTPCLDNQRASGRLVVFSRATTPTNATASAMRYIFSLKSCNSRSGEQQPYVLMPAVFRKANYDVRYFDNQYTRSSGGSLDYSCGYFLNPQPINSQCFSFRNDTTMAFDADFVSHYAARFGVQPKSLNIIHLMGQHFDARQRYPETFAVFKASDIKRKDLNEEERQRVADYDNATLYNDHSVGLILQRFMHRDAVVVYLSDHGEQVYDGPNHFFGRYFGDDQTPETLNNVFQVPFVVWYSDIFAHRHPALAQKLRSAAGKPFCIDDVPYLLFHLAGIDFNYNQPQRDILDANYRWHASKISDE